MRATKFLLVLPTVILIFATSVSASPVEITSRALLGANELLDWSAFGPAFTLVPNGSTVTTPLGNTVTVSNTVEPATPFRVFQQVPPVVTGFWNGNFAPRDLVLSPNGRPGDILIQFATPVFGAGAQIQAALLGSDFTATIVVTDIHGTTSFSETGASNSNADNSAIFLGVRDSVADIVSIDYSATGLGTDTNGPGINQLSISETPVPATLPLFATGLGGLGLLGWRRKRKSAAAFAAA
jgi:hypothetical protein